MKRHAFPLAVTATITALVLSGCGDDDEPTNNADDPASTPASETSDAGRRPTPTTTPSRGAERDRDHGSDPDDRSRSPVFFVADTPQGPALFAEQREVEADNPLEEAVALMTAGDAADADYRHALPRPGARSDERRVGRRRGSSSPTVRRRRGTRARPGMSRPTPSSPSSSSSTPSRACEGEEGMTGSGHRADNEEARSSAWTACVQAADELDVRGLVNVLSPAEGATVSGSFTASGEASSFEATVPWQVRDESGKMVLEGFATAEGWIDGLYPWEAEVDVSEPRARHLHVRGHDRRPVRRRGPRPDRGHQDDRRRVA